MKTNTIYFYTNGTVQKKLNNEFYVNFYTVIKVNQFNNNTDEAERKARTIAQNTNSSLAGGIFCTVSKARKF